MPLESELRDGIRLIFVFVSIAHAYRSFWIRMGLVPLWGPVSHRNNRNIRQPFFSQKSQPER